MTKPTYSSSSYSDTLKRILNVARNVQRDCGASLGTQAGSGQDPQPSTSESPRFELPRLPLSIVEDKLRYLNRSQVPSDLIRLFERYSSELRRCSEESILNTWTQIGTMCTEPRAHHLRQRVYDAQLHLYKRHVDKWLDDALMQLSQASEIRSSTRETKARAPFNHDYVPLLEHFFNENPFPSHADKKFLAKKSGMTFRQIHVWFQNRRNRTKKEGADLKKRSTGMSTLPLDKLISRMRDHVIPEGQRLQPPSPSSYGDSALESDEDDSHITPSCDPHKQVHGILATSAPPHAFPSAYPPSCSYDPFPNISHPERFPPPEWERQSVRSRKDGTMAIDILTLTEMFAQLAIKDVFVPNSRRKGLPKSSLNGYIPQSYALGFDVSVVIPFSYIKPLPAPLPSLIQTSHVASASHILPLPVIPAPASRRHVFNTPSPRSKPTTLVPVSRTETPTRKVTGARKIAPLPKRIPKSRSIAHRSTTSTMSRASVIPSLSMTSSSRASSCGSSESRLFSGTSSSSSSPRVRTPATSSTSLPRIITPTLSMPGFSPYQQPSSMSYLFAGFPVGTPLQAEGLQLDMNFFGDPHIAKASDFDFFGIPPSTNLVHAQS